MYTQQILTKYDLIEGPLATAVRSGGSSNDGEPVFEPKPSSYQMCLISDDFAESFEQYLHSILFYWKKKTINFIEKCSCELCCEYLGVLTKARKLLRFCSFETFLSIKKQPASYHRFLTIRSRNVNYKACVCLYMWIDFWSQTTSILQLRLSCYARSNLQSIDDCFERSMKLGVANNVF